MADEELSVAEELAETPASPPAQAAEEPTELPEGLENEETGEEQPEEELDEFEHEGKAYRVPKSLVPHLMRDKDYTQSKQSIADQRRALEAEQAKIEERAKLTDEELDLKAEIKSLDKTLDAYKKLTQEDWDHHYANDYVAADQHWRRFQLLEKQRSEVAQNLEGKAKERTEASQSDLTKRAQQALAEAPKIIPGWKAETANQTITELYQYAQSEGIPDQVLAANWGPSLMKLLHRARLGDQLLKKQATAPKAQPADPPQPTVTVRPKNTPPPTGLSDKLPVDEWLRRREAQVRKKA